MTTRGKQFANIASIALAPVLLIVGLIFVSTSRSVDFMDRSPLSTELPVSLSGWSLVPVLYCRNDQCLRSMEYSNKPPQQCSYCGAPLDTQPYAEKIILPPDTIIRHGRYIGPDGRRLQVNIVVSGQSRSSMHKPEWCLTGQGFQIIKESVMQVDRDEDSPLLVSVLDLKSGEASASRQKAYFAYWFIGPDNVTHSRFTMVMHMMRERLLERKAYRWAYIAVILPEHESRDQTSQELSGFIKEIYSKLETKK